MNITDILKKIKQKGVKGCAESLEWHSANAINKSIFYCWQKKPIDNSLIVMESGGEITDNAYALYDYMGKNGYLNKYHVVWLVYEISGPRKEHKIQHLYPNTEIVWGNPSKVHKEWDKYLATCKWHIYDHSNMMAPFKKRKETVVVNLWHGCGFKAPKGDNGQLLSTATVNFITGRLFRNTFEIWFKCKESELVDLGYSRNDYFFENISVNQKKIAEYFDLQKYKKIYLWMPTFRNSISNSLSEQYFDSKTGLPIIENEELLQQFNKYLSSINSLCIFKVHHLQAELDVFKKKYSNIIVLRDSDIASFNLQLYQVVVFADCLITDYSSIANDYILLDRPMIYTIDDYEEYKSSRGFIPSNPIEYFAGACVKNYQEFINAVQDVADGKDKYKEKRKRILPLMHTHPDGNSSQRIVNYIGLKL